MKNVAILDDVLKNYKNTVELLKDDYSPEILEKLYQPQERIELTLAPRLSDGKIHIIKAFIVLHSYAIGPAKGGIRMSPFVNIDIINGLAMEMTWKCSLIGVPFGGGKSGICIDPRELSASDKETIIRSFARNARRHIGPHVYVPASDMGTGEPDMGYIKDAIAHGSGEATTMGCYVTSKPVILGGIPGRRDATGRGVMVASMEALKVLNIKPEEATAVVQGFGNVGSVAARLLAEQGVKVIATSDVDGAVYNPDGLDIPALLKHSEETGSVVGFSGGENIEPMKILELECDILSPSAAQNQITLDNADKIKAKIIAEGANSPTTIEADKILNDKGIFIIPDILCNAGGVFVSYLEYTQEHQREQISEDVVNERLRKRMIERFEKVYQLSLEKKLSMRRSAMYLAVKNVCDAVIAHGFQP